MISAQHAAPTAAHKQDSVAFHAAKNISLAESDPTVFPLNLVSESPTESPDLRVAVPLDAAAKQPAPALESRISVFEARSLAAIQANASGLADQEADTSPDALRYNTSMAVGLQLDKAGWYDSGVDRNCNQGCAAHGLIGVEADMKSHLHEVDTNAKLKAMIAAVGGTTIADACSSEHSNSRSVPVLSSDACHIPETNVVSGTRVRAQVVAL